MLQVAEDGVIELVDHERDVAPLREVEVRLQTEQNLARPLGGVEAILDAALLDRRLGLAAFFDHAVVEQEHRAQRARHFRGGRVGGTRIVVFRHVEDLGKSKEQPSELRSLMRTYYSVFRLKKKKNKT